ncbi:Ribonuclease Z [Neofusicoccum parvum]|nr:Ribonuclease Z [Neofusicoccum parvum]
MSTVAAQPMGYTPFPNQCFDPDMDSLVDFNAIPSPGPASSSSHMPPSTVASTMTSPTNTIRPLDLAEDHQTPAKPSHEYDLFKQQTGLPSGSVPGIGMSQSMSGNYSQVFSNSGIGLDDGWGSGLGDMDMDMGNSGLPAFFFPQGENSQSEDFVDPSAIQDQPQQNVRFFPGMHQQQAALAKAQAQAQQQRQQQMLQHQHQQREQQSRVNHAQRKSAQFSDARTEETIARVVNQIRHNSTLSSNGSDCGSNPLPHIIKMKKDEEDMDEDERLLASEEGKKLSSKERRQLRNKVSARAFRSRRKEYIGQLEGEVASKTNENTELRMQNRSLMEENARSRAFIERLLRHQAFGPFLDELSRDPALTGESAKLPTNAPAQAPQQASSAPQMMKQTSQNHSQMGMSMIPEQSATMSFDNMNYFPNTGFNFNNPQVFAVLEVPEGPANPFDTEILSGKGSSTFSPVEEIKEIKPDYPVIERPETAETEAEKPVEAVAEVEDVDDGNPDFALYYNSPAPSAAAPSEPMFGNIAPEKAFGRIEVVVSQETTEQLQQRLERSIAKFDAVYERMQSMMFLEGKLCNHGVSGLRSGFNFRSCAVPDKAKDYTNKSMRSYIQILTTPTADTPGTTVLLHFDDKRYLFGSLGEGTQRAMNQIGTRMLRTQELFITGRSEWSNTGGLVGMMLTLSDVLAASNLDKKERGLDATPKVLSMFGPPNLNHTIAACRRFVFRKGMPINAVDIKDEEVKKDENGDQIPLFVDNNIKAFGAFEFEEKELR